MFGREVMLPLGIIVGMPPGVTDRVSKRICWVGQGATGWVSQQICWMGQEQSRRLFWVCQGKFEGGFLTQKRAYDKNAKHWDYTMGSWVWKWYPSKACQKLGVRWTGPYRVMKWGGETVLIQKDQGSCPLWVHQDDLKPYRSPTPPEPWTKFMTYTGVTLTEWYQSKQAPTWQWMQRPGERSQEALAAALVAVTQDGVSN